MISVKVEIHGIYSYMVYSENYRVLSKFDYSWKETSIRSGRIAVPPAVTDVSFIIIYIYYLLAPRS